MTSASTIGYTKIKEYAAGNLNGHKYLSWTGKPAKAIDINGKLIKVA